MICDFNGKENYFRTECLEKLSAEDENKNKNDDAGADEKKAAETKAEETKVEEKKDEPAKEEPKEENPPADAPAPEPAAAPAAAADAGAGAGNADDDSTTEEETPAVVPDSEKFEEGDRILITGLNSVPQFNNTKGTIVRWDEEKERYRVNTDVDGKENKLAVDKLQKVGRIGTEFRVGDKVTITGLTSFPKYNNTEAMVVRYDTEVERWICRCGIDSKDNWFEHDFLKFKPYEGGI